MSGRVRVYIACSLDGFIAGEGDDLSWLPGVDGAMPEPGPGALGYDDFMAGAGALLMGRRTYDVVTALGVPWPYGDRPVLVATGRPLDPAAETVRPVAGTIEELAAAARDAAGGKDVYLDGGNLIRQGLAARLVDELVVTVVPVILGRGIPLFAGMEQRVPLETAGHHSFGGGMVQLRYRPAHAAAPAHGAAGGPIFG